MIRDKIENKSTAGQSFSPNEDSRKLALSSTSSPKSGVPPQQDISYPYHISPSTIPGLLHLNNYGAVDWSANGLIAYGCQNRIVIVDSASTITYCQTLHRHKHVVCYVKWSPASNDNQLASVDISGVIIVWDVVESTPLTVILSTNETKIVYYFQWIFLNKRNADQNDLTYLDRMNESIYKQEPPSSKSTILPKTSFLLAFYQQTSSFILYDAELGEPVVKWLVDFKVTHVAFNPFFDFNRACDSSVFTFLFAFKSAANDDKLYFGLSRLNEHDFISENSSKEPKKLNLSFTNYILQNSFTESVNKTNRSSRYDLLTRLEQSNISKCLISAHDATHSNSPGTNTALSVSSEGFLQIEFHKSLRNQVFIVFPRDIYLVDFSIETIINVIPLERNCSKIIKILSCGHRNAFYVFHESGNVSFRLYQKKIIRDRSNINNNLFTGASWRDDGLSDRLTGDGISEKNASSFLNVGYINLCQSEAIRLTKQNKIYGHALMPFDETRVAFLLSSGRIVIKSLTCQTIVQLESNATVGLIANQVSPASCLSDLIKPQEYQLGAFLVGDTSSEEKLFDSISYKILITHFISGLNSAPTVIRMCPPLTLQNIKKHRPLLAVGDSLGLLQIWLLNGNTSNLYREFSVHSYPVAGIEWTSLNSLVSFSFPTINSPSHMSAPNSPFSALSIVTGSGSSSGRVTNELVYIDIDTGKVSQFRTNRVQDSSPIDTIRVSHLKQYLIILFKHDDPFEIWDIKRLQLLRVMPKNLSNITAVEWSPLYNKRQMSRNSEVSDSDTNQHSICTPIKENFIVTNRNLFHFSIEGNLVREMSCIPPDADSGHVNVTSIAWKSDQVLLGDASGTLNLWHLKRKVSATEPTFRGYIRKIRFGPGRGNMKCLILYSDFGVDIWDINDFKVCAQLKYPRDMNFKIVDVDWASCDMPILCTAEGFIFLTDTKLKTYSSPISLKEVDQPQLEQLFVGNDDGAKIDPMFNAQLVSSFNLIRADAKQAILRHSIFTLPRPHSIYLQRTSSSSSQDQDNNRDSLSIIDTKRYIEWQTLRSRLLYNASDVDFWSILNSILYGEELDSRLDMFLDCKHFRYLQHEKLLVLESNRKTYAHARYAYQLNLQLKNFQRSVQILLEMESFQLSNNGAATSDAVDNVFYVDALKACLIASLQCDAGGREKQYCGATVTKQSSKNVNDKNGSENEPSDIDASIGHDSDSESFDDRKGAKDAVAPVIKLVATSLIANGRILEGVELLNFISKTYDSCRYLQSAEKWLESVWLAKSNLDPNECNEVIRRWCEMLTSSTHCSDQQTAVKMYLSRRQFSRVLRTLNRLSDLKAFPFAVICAAAQLIDIEANRDVLEEIFDKFATAFFDQDEKTLIDLKNGLSSRGEDGDTVRDTDYQSDKKRIPESASHVSLSKIWSILTEREFDSL